MSHWRDSKVRWEELRSVRSNSVHSPSWILLAAAVLPVADWSVLLSP